MLPKPQVGILLVVVAVLGVGVGLARWRIRYRRPQAGTGACILWCASFWLAATGLQLASTDLEAKLAWNRAQFVGMLPIPLLWLYLVMQFTGFDRFMTIRRLLLLSIVPALTLVLVVTDQYHRLIFARTWLDTSSVTSMLRNEFGPGLWLGIIYSYGLLVTATLLLVWMMIRRTGFLWQGTALLIAVFLSIGANVVDMADRSPFGEIDMTPLALLVTVPLFIASLIRLQRTDIVPVARGSVMNGMRDPVMVLDNENRIIDLNPAAQQLIGWRLSEVRGKPLAAVWPAWGEDADKFSRDDPSRPIIKLSQDNRQRTLTVNVSRLKDWRDQIISHVLVFRDISELVDAEEALRHSEEHFRALTENVTDVVVIVSADGTIQYASPSIEREYGFDPGEFVGQRVLSFVHPEDISKATIALAEARQQARTTVSIAVRFQHITSKWRTFHCVINNLLEHPAVSGIVVNAHDVTDQTLAEEQLRASLAEKETLLKEIHHRVKNNMQVIASLLSLQSGIINDPATRAQFEDSQNRIRSMALVHERLYRSQDLTSIDFKEYVEELTGHLMQSYRLQCKKVEVVIDVEHIQLDIDTAIPCGLIINELMSNALKHAFPNGAEGIIKIEARRDGVDSYCLSVRDNGVGMPSDIDLAHSKTLGLQLVSSLSRQLNGIVSLDTENGTRVTLRFSSGSDQGLGSKTNKGKVEHVSIS